MLLPFHVFDAFPSGTNHCRLISPETTLAHLYSLYLLHLPVSILPSYSLHRRGYVNGNGLMSLGAEARLLPDFLLSCIFSASLSLMIPVYSAAEHAVQQWDKHHLSLAAVTGNKGTFKFTKEHQQIPYISAPKSIWINCFGLKLFFLQGI